MTKTEALALLEDRLPGLDAEQTAVLAELAHAMAAPAVDFTGSERAGIARGEADFAAGRTFSSADARALSVGLAAKRRGLAST